MIKIASDNQGVTNKETQHFIDYQAITQKRNALFCLRFLLTY